MLDDDLPSFGSGVTPVIIREECGELYGEVDDGEDDSEVFPSVYDEEGT